MIHFTNFACADIDHDKAHEALVASITIEDEHSVNSEKPHDEPNNSVTNIILFNHVSEMGANNEEEKWLIDDRQSLGRAQLTWEDEGGRGRNLTHGPLQRAE